MKRYYLSKIFQDVNGDYGLAGAWMHRFQAISADVDYRGGEIAVDPQSGVPTQQALLILVGAVDHKPFQDDPDLVPLPDVAPDVKVSSIHAPRKLLAKAAIVALGFGAADTDALWGGADGLRDGLNHCGRLNNPEFDTNAFDLTDL